MITIAGIADTHYSHLDVHPLPADILVVAGDFCGHGKIEEVAKFNAWLGTLSHKHKIVVAGNHDIIAQNNANIMKGIFTNAIYLDMESVEVLGIKFFGCPWTPEFNDWAFMYPHASAEAERIWAKVPHDTNILISHGPPIGTKLSTMIGSDGYPQQDCGCPILRNRIETLPNLVTTFHGHIHSGHGVEKIGEVVCHNVSVVDELYDVVNNGLVYKYGSSRRTDE